mgnify:CR=1 FL=1
MNYVLADVGDLDSIVNLIQERMPDGTSQALLFATENVNYKHYHDKISSACCMKLAGGIVGGIGDYFDCFHPDRILLIFLPEGTTIKREKIKKFYAESHSMIFTSTERRANVLKALQRRNFKYFGSDLYQTFYGDQSLGQDDILSVSCSQLAVKMTPFWTDSGEGVFKGENFQVHDTSHIDITTQENLIGQFTRSPAKLVGDFLDLSEEAYIDSPNWFIITCDSRILNMGPAYLAKLEATKYERFKNRKFYGYGFSSNGIYYGEGVYANYSTGLVGFANYL